MGRTNTSRRGRLPDPSSTRVTRTSRRSRGFFHSFDSSTRSWTLARNCWQSLPERAPANFRNLLFTATLAMPACGENDDEGFYLDANGITVRCPDVEVGDSG